MLNTQFPSSIDKLFKVDPVNFILPDDLQKKIISINSNLTASKELRLQSIYGDELWLKIKRLGLENFDWQNSQVLDVASGEGFLSYHLLKRISPKELTLADISQTASEESRKLLTKNYPNINIKYLVSDVLKSGLPDNSFDVIIGNSFIHHFYNLPEAFSEFYRLLKPGGIFISLHEPLVGAVAYESGKFSYLLLWLLRGKRYIKDIRKIKGEFPLENNRGGDVWLFEETDLKRLLLSAGFEYVILNPWHAFKTFFIGLFGLSLSVNNPELGPIKRGFISFGIKIDNILSKFLPSSFFGSISVCAYKKKI